MQPFDEVKEMVAVFERTGDAHASNFNDDFFQLNTNLILFCVRQN
jgi:hypothetical protein